MAAKTTDPIDILLEMGIDLDNLSEEEDYLSALMEAANTLTIKDASDPRIAPLQQEILKLRKKRFNKARPEAKKTTIKPDAFFDRKSDEEKSGTIDPSKLKFDSVEFAEKQKALPTSAIVPYQAPEEEEGVKKKRAPRKSDPLKDILKGVNSIIEILKRQQKLSAKQAEKDRKRAEREKRKGSEDKLESSGIKNFMSGVSKLIKPVRGFLDGLFDFIKNVIIGAVLIKIIKWFTDPENKEKIEAIGAFFKNTWPALLAAYLLFGNSFTSFIAKMLLKVGIFTAKLIGTVIPALIGAIKRFGLGKSAKLLSVVGGTALLANRLMDGGKDDVDLTKGEDDKDSAPTPAGDEDKPETKRMVAGQEYDPANPTELQKKATDMSTQMGNPPPAKMKGGGMVPGSGPNRDTVPAMLAPGEFVMSRGAVQKYGASTMASMNAAGGGTNLPKRMNGVTYAAGGGLMGDMSDYGYGDDKKEEPSPTVAKEMEERKEKASNPVGDFFGGMASGVRSLFGSSGDEAPPEPPSVPDSERKIGEADPDAKVEPLSDNPSDKEAFMHIYNIAKKVGGTKWPEIVAAQAMHETGYLKMKPSVYFATGKTNPFGQTGDRGYGTIPRQGDPAGWTKYPNLEEAVRDHIKLWHNVGNHPENYNAYDTILDGIAVVSKAYSPNSDPANIRLGYTTDAYSKGMVRALKVGGFDVKTTRKGDAPKMTPGGSTPRPGGGGVSPSGTTPSGTTPKKPHKFGSGIAALTGTNPFVSSGGSAPPGPPMSSFQALQNPAPKSSTSQGSGNSSATQVPNQNQFPSIDANAMISREKIKVLGLTVA